MTSGTRYPIRDDEAWDRLAALLRVVPVCLVESGDGPSDSAWVVGRDVIWTREPPIDTFTRRGLECGIRDLAARLGLATCEVQFTVTARGPCCAGLDVYPRLDGYDAAAQEAIVEGIVCLLESGA
jgi:hypothetical protein